MYGPQKSITLLQDKCTDCKICELLCSATREHVFNRGKARLHVERQGLLDVSLSICHLCESPACVTSCPTRAVEVSDGLHLVHISPADCISCGLCVRACPHGALSLWQPKRVPIICDFCAGHPKCVDGCPWSALVYDFDTNGRGVETYAS